MRNKINKLLKLGILVFGISLLFTNCNKEDDYNLVNENLNELKFGHQINKLSLNEVSKIAKLKKSLQDLSGNFDVNKSKDKENSRNSKIDANDGSFTILTNEILQIVTDSIETYSFVIETPTLPSSEFENFIIDVKTDSTINYFIIRYELETNTQSDFPYNVTSQLVDSNLINIDSLNLFNKVEIEQIGDCFWEVYYNVDGDPIEMNFLFCTGGGGSGGGDTDGGDPSDTGDDTDTAGGTNTGESGGGIPHNNTGTDTTSDTDSDIGPAPIAINKPKVPKILKDSTFENSQLDCIYEKLKGNHFSQPTFFTEMIDVFRANNSLTLSIGATPVTGGTAFTKGETIEFFGQTLNSYEIISSSEAEAASNLDKMVTLSHELMHAFMYTSMQENGLIHFNSIGAPEVSNPTTLCTSATIIPNINLNTLTIKERWTYLLCEIYIMNGNSFPFQWTHSLFESPVFVLETYREKLEQLLLEKHDWDSEPNDIKNFMISIFGSNWKQKVAEYMSWSGLDQTPEFNIWLATQASFTTTGFPTTNSLYYDAVTRWWTNPADISYVSSNCI